MTLKEFRETSRMRAYSDHARKYELLIEAPSMLALLDYVDALEKASTQVIGEYDDTGNDGAPSSTSLSALRIALAKGEVEI